MSLAARLRRVAVFVERFFSSRVRDQAEARELGEQMSLALIAARIGYWDWDVLNDKHVWSDTCKVLLGLPPNANVNFDALIKAVHPDDRTQLWSAIDRAVRDKAAYVCEFRVLWPDGSMHWCVGRGRAFLDGMGRTSRMIGIVADIDERKASDSNLRLLTAALEAAANAIVITDPNGAILWVNQAFTDLTGYGREESIGQNPRMLKSSEHDHSFYENLWSTIKAGRVWRGELKNRKKDGSLYNEEMTVTPVRSASGEITNFIAIKQDVTEKKKLEAQYRQAQKMEAVGRLAGGIAHDFNNVLSVIIGYSFLALEKLEPADQVVRYLQNIKTAADRAAALVKQLLTFSRQQVVYPRILDLNVVVKNMEDMLRKLVGEDVSIIIKATMPLGSIKADVGQIEQVVMNLVVNARDAMAEGGQITLETRNVDLDEGYQREHEPVQPGQYVMLSVYDTGCGMDERTKARIFEPFYTTKEPGVGTGLGLATVYGIVKQSNGYIWVYSEPGTGTTFKLYFPRINQTPEQIIKPSQDSEIRGGSETILLVEDDEAVRELLVITLRNAGYTVFEVGDAEAALELAANQSVRIDLLVSDIVMPSISGSRLITLLRLSRPDLKVILMSGYAAETLARQVPVPHDVTFMEKPFTRNSLLMVIRRILDSEEENNKLGRVE
jgi:two-component system, cell cycle sensor histidine kinase and response regulator CckA